uniref:Variable lymphocyte receptor A cassette n=1 Tax=Petromyzon marinus TaxID=7757 RepID=S4RTY2_PETMA
MNLNTNQLQSSLPSGVFDRLTKLKELWLNSNQL